MSHVQLWSNALERLEARRTFPLHARTSACRSLFGPVDHDELNQEMKAKLQEISDRDRQRWNFNFEADTPLDGDYEWEESAADETPTFYQDSVQIGKTRVVVASAKVRPCPDSDLGEPPCLDVQPVCDERLASPASSGAPCATAEVNQENRTDGLNSGRQTHRRTQCVRRKRRAPVDLNTTYITDFYVKCKKPVEMKSNDSGCHHSSSPIPVEQTPRKRIR